MEKGLEMRLFVGFPATEAKEQGAECGQGHSVTMGEEDGQATSG
jgi:hypothetical protein